MLSSICKVLYVAFYMSLVSAGGIDDGYTYEKPAAALRLVSAAPNIDNGHHFGFLPTIQPLPAVPALPPLPTPRPRGQITQTQTLYQTHPVATVGAIQKTYLPTAGSNIGRIAQQYQPPSLQTLPPPPPASDPSVTVPGSNVPTSAPAPAQPLRVPYGKQAIIRFPGSVGESSNTYQANGRQLKQYAVIEIIDNDIEQNTQPFISSPFFNSYRAYMGATGTGAAPAPLNNGGGVQLNSRAGTSVLEQQRSSLTDAIALGSGGLGFIRLANGNVYLGSGSLGYISGQQHMQSINEARTRTGAPRPDPLHFGHGPLGGLNRVNRFLFRF